MVTQIRHCTAFQHRTGTVPHARQFLFHSGDQISTHDHLLHESQHTAKTRGTARLIFEVTDRNNTWRQALV
jgi:hypothetical protein